MWIIVAAGGFLVLASFLLWLPVHLLLDIDTASGQKYRFTVAFLLGVIKMRPRLRGAPPRIPEPGKLFDLLRVEGLSESAWRLLRDTARRIHVSELDVHIRLGGAASACNGVVAGALAALRPLFKLPQKCDIDIRPSFETGSAFEGSAHLDASARPLAMLFPLARFALSRPGRQARRIARRSRVKRAAPTAQTGMPASPV